MAFSDEVNITISFTAYTRQAEVLILYLVFTGKQTKFGREYALKAVHSTVHNQLNC